MAFIYETQKQSITIKKSYDRKYRTMVIDNNPNVVEVTFKIVVLTTHPLPLLGKPCNTDSLPAWLFQIMF